MRSAVLLAMLALAACVSAARVPALESIKEGSFDLSNVQFLSAMSRKEPKARIMFRYFMTPNAAREFEDEWVKFEKDVEDEEGLELLDLKRFTDNNYEYLAYGEWKSWEDFMEHYECDASRKLREYLAKAEINFSWEPVFKAADEDVKPSKGDREAEKYFAHVIVRYSVHPDMHKEFVDAWQKTQELTADEKHNRIYALRKSVQSNTVFYTYGTWDDLKGFIDHLESDHVRDLLKFAADNSISWTLSPLKKVGNQPE